MLMYENENYKIVANTDRRVYQVINKCSGMVEEEQEIFPKALTSAHMYNDSIERFKQRQQEKANVVAIGSKSKDATE